MFKKFIHIAVSMLLLVTTTGVNLNLHFSGEQLFSFSLVGEADSCCETDCNCCDETTIKYQIKDEFNASSFDNKISITILDLPQILSETSTNMLLAQIHSETERLILLKLPDKRPDLRSDLQIFLI